MADFTEIIQEINTNLPDNNTQSITAEKLRTTLIDLTNTIDTVQTNYETEVNTTLGNIVVDNLTSSDVDKALSAKQGKVLDEKINETNEHIIVRTPVVPRSSTPVLGSLLKNGSIYSTGHTWKYFIFNIDTTKKYKANLSCREVTSTYDYCGIQYFDSSDNYLGYEITTNSTIYSRDFYITPPSGTTYCKIQTVVSEGYNPSELYTYEYTSDVVENSDIEDIPNKIGESEIRFESVESPVDFRLTDEAGRILLEISQGNIKTKNFDSSAVSSKRSLKIFLIGNSFTYDLMAYAPFVLNTITDKIDFEIGIAKISGASLATQYNSITGSTADYEFSYIKSGDSAWTIQSSKTFDYCISYADWDVVTLQQNSLNSPVWSTYEPYLSNIIDILYGRGKNYKLGWILTQASADGSTRFPGPEIDPDGLYQTSDNMYNGIASCAQKVLENTPISFVIPDGTAIQNARHNSTLDALGTFGHLSYDGYHLQEGIPSLIVGYTAVIWLLRECGMPMGIFGNTVRPTDSWRTGKNIPGIHGSAVGVTDSNCRIAQKCALIAYNTPYEITEGIQ